MKNKTNNVFNVEKMLTNNDFRKFLAINGKFLE